WINSLIKLSAIVLLYYEYLLTLSREIQFLWPPHNKLGWFTFACLLNRYLPLFGHLPIFLPYLITASSDVRPSCEGLRVYDEWFVTLMQARLAVLLVLRRVYALYDRSRCVLGVLVFLCVVMVITAVCLFVNGHAGDEPIPIISSFPGCPLYLPPSGGRFSAIPWMGLLLYDCVVFCLTLYKASTMGSGIKLLNVIVRDGRALFIINLVNILTLWFSEVCYYAFQCLCSSLTFSHLVPPN
ncbi:hypothetical protein BJV74DRAFT_871245, partial [Russula compacta]